jgi:hypothetical protein
MKQLQFLFVLLISFFIISSCQKELNWDLNAQSQGTLKADTLTSECLPSSVHGVYQNDSTLTNDNYIDVQVNVTSAGIYSINSDTVNGYSFHGNGTFGQTGINTVRLYGSGTPQLPGMNTFIISYNNSYCIIDVEVVAQNGTPNAVYTLGGAGATCTGAVASGTYMQGLVLTSSNTVSVNVSVSTAGQYTMNTNTVNGVSFSASGLFALGTTGVTLTGTGTPQAAGTFNYALTGAGSTCSYSVTFAPAAGPAAFSLGGAPSGCTGAVLNGSYASGVAMNSTNTATIQVNVSTAGSYTIGTNTVNGITFTASGIFTATGVQQVTLYASGTPTTAGAFDYNVAGGGSTCVISVPVTGAVTDFITCDIDGVFATFNVNATAGLSNASGPSVLSIDGSSNSTSIDPSISFGIIKSMGGSITAGTYNVNQLATGITVTCDYNDATSTNYFCGTDGNNQNQNPGFTITISTLTATRCIGTFQGQVKDNGGVGPGVKVITNGVFNVPVQ